MPIRQRELLKGSLDAMLLQLLADEPMYSYQLIKELRTRSNDLAPVKEGLLYPALHRLENRNLLESFWQLHPDGVNRRYYRLTVQGRMALRERRSEWMQFATAVQGVLRYG